MEYGKATQEQMKKKPLSKRKKRVILLSTVSGVLSIPLVVIPLLTIIIYESIFGARYETASWLAFSAEDFEGLRVEACEFSSEDQTLAGYLYSGEAAGEAPKGVVILAHGMGGGGQNGYMPFANAFAQAGYLVFAYDATGNDQSEGDSVEGLPRGLIDLDNAINYLCGREESDGLPLFLFGHSWGGYAVGTVLNLHPEVAGAVIVSGFNESEDLIRHQGEQIVGGAVHLLAPYVSVYEALKFGDYAGLSAVDGMAQSNARIMIVHSRDDQTVPTEYGYDTFYEAFGDNDRFHFVLYEDRGHDSLFYSEEARAYREELNAEYLAYVETHGGEHNAEIKTEFMSEYLDKQRCFEPDPDLMSQILTMFEEARTQGVR